VRDILLVIKREFGERVASRSFVVGTLLFPDDNTYKVTKIDGTVGAARDRLAARLLAKEFDGYIALPSDVLQSGNVVFRAHKSGSFAVIRDLRTAGTRAVQSERLKRSGIDASAIAALVAPVVIDEARITARGEERGGALSTFLTAYIVAFLIYLMTTLYGVAVMRSVLEEKTNRIAEVLMSTIRASHLMAGKIIGVGSAAVVQVVIWVAITIVVATQADKLGQGFALPDTVLQALNVSPGTGILLFSYFLLGFFLYASVFAMVGAAVTSEQEAQSVQFIALIPMIAPMLFLESILNAPLGRLSTVLGLIPFTSPITMPMRMASTPVPPAEIAASLGLLVLGIAGVAWIAGKVYRVGILSTGKKPTLKELARWVRSA
jgi:ABC-2 type transport system permease protein